MCVWYIYLYTFILQNYCTGIQLNISYIKVFWVKVFLGSSLISCRSLVVNVLSAWWVPPRTNENFWGSRAEFVGHVGFSSLVTLCLFGLWGDFLLADWILLATFHHMFFCQQKKVYIRGMFFSFVFQAPFPNKSKLRKIPFFLGCWDPMADALVLILCRKAAIDFLVPGETRQPGAVKKDAVPQNLCVPEKSASNEANQILVDGLWTKMFYVYFYVAEIGPKMDPLSGARNHRTQRSRIYKWGEV